MDFSNRRDHARSGVFDENGDAAFREGGISMSAIELHQEAGGRSAGQPASAPDGRLIYGSGS
jgi:hypothetical protein